MVRNFYGPRLDLYMARDFFEPTITTLDAHTKSHTIAMRPTAKTQITQHSPAQLTALLASLPLTMFTVLASLIMLTSFPIHAGNPINDTSTQQLCLNLLSPAANVDLPLTQEWLEKLRESSPSSQQSRLNDAVQTAGFGQVALNRDIIKNHTSKYSNEVQVGCITNQRSSGRCWIFAGNNMLRAELLKEKKVGTDFSLSHTYLHFYNMLEKANRWLWNVEQAQLKKMSRHEELHYIGKIGDGGWYEWYQFLVQKYGVVPQSAMPETAGSLNTQALLQAIQTVTAQSAYQIKKKTQEWRTRDLGTYTTEQAAALHQLRHNTMEKVYRIIETHLGRPPVQFDFTGEDKKKRNYNPQSFRDEFLNYRPDDYVTIGNNARHGRERLYQLRRSTIAVPEYTASDYPIRILNLPFARVDELIRSAIDANRPMWFATDVRKYLDATKSDPAKNTSGIWHPELFKFADVYGIAADAFQMQQAEQMEYQLTLPTHAMVIVAYDKPDANAPTIKYKVENSWGDEFGEKGFGHMYREWAELYVTEVVVHKSLLNPKELELLSTPPEDIDEDDYY